jgi:two-component system OmpR family sensor kinase
VSRSQWSLQTRLIVAVVGFVSLILVTVGLAIGTILGQIMQDNLDGQIRTSVSNIPLFPTATAEEVLNLGRQETGTLLVMRTYADLSAAYVADEDSVDALDPDAIESLVPNLDAHGWGTVSVPDLGEYRVWLQGDPGGRFILVGLPTSEVTATIARIATTVALFTAGGLVLLAVVISLIIRRSLRPLRAVAETATRVASLPLAEGEVSIAERVPAEEADDRSEIGRVGAALNTLLDHVGESLAARQRNEERMRAFVADASHELRTPLASIRGYSELSLRSLAQAGVDTDPDGPQLVDVSAVAGTVQALERIQAQSLRMTSLVEDLLLLARLDEGQELVYATVDLSQLAIEAVSDASAAGRDHGWELEVGEDPVIVAGDAPRLHQVAANLLANARLHTPEGTTVTTSVERDGDVAVLRVHDDGPGIDPDVADALFERFARADASRARKTGGTGLGLSIAKAIVQAHRGSIAVDSRPGSTTFEVRLPARPEDPRRG